MKPIKSLEDLDSVLSPKAGAVSSVADLDAFLQQEEPAEGNILTDLGAGLKIGSKQALASSIGGLQAVGKEYEIPIHPSVDKFKQMLQQSVAKNVQETPIASTPFTKAPIRKTLFNVASSTPQMIAALGVTAVTKNPLLGASTFGPSALGSFYDEAIAAGKTHSEAFGPALTNSISQVALENIPLTGWLKGGSLGTRIARGIIQEGIIEEGTQQIVQNTLEAMTWKGYDHFAENLIKDTTEAIVAGSVMGAGMGAISPTTWEDVKHDVIQKAEKVKKQMIEQATQDGKPAEEIQQAASAIDTLVQKLFEKSPDKYREAVAKNIIKNPEFLNGKIELAFGDKQVDVINESTLLTDEQRLRATDMAKTFDEKFAKYPSVLQDMIISWVNNKIESQQLTEEEIAKEYGKAKADWAKDEHIYISGAGKKSEGGIDPGTKVYSMKYGETSLSTLALLLKAPEFNQNGEITRYSVTPDKWVMAYAYKGDKKTNLPAQFKSVMEKIYNKSKIQEVKQPVPLSEFFNRSAESIPVTPHQLDLAKLALASGQGQGQQQPEAEPEPTGDAEPPAQNMDEVQKATYDQLKAVDGKEIKTTEWNNNPRTLPARIVTNVMKWTRFPTATKNFLEYFFGEKNVKEAMSPKPKVNLKDEVVSAIYTDKSFRRLAGHLAWDQTRPVFETIMEVASKLAITPEGKPDKQKLEKIVEILNEIMVRASEEIYSEEGKADQYSTTKVGIGGLHNLSDNPLPGTKANAEAFAYGLDMKTYHDFLQIKYTDADLQRWSKSRDTLSFFNLLGTVDPILQKAVIWLKAEIEHPLLQAQLDQGVFQNADMWENISKGYSHRVFIMRDQQKESKGAKFNVPSSLDSRSVPAAKYRTFSEFALQTKSQGMDVVEGLIASQQEYIKESLLRIQQLETLGMLKEMIAPNPRTIKGFEENQAVNDLIASARYVEYTDSVIIKAIAKLTNLRNQDILQQLGYAQANEAPGLVEWSRGLFRTPYMTEELRNFINAVFEPKGTNDGPLGTFNAITNYMKRIITIQPFDSTFLWMSPVIVNSPLFVLEIPGMLAEEARVAYRGVKEGTKILKGKEWLKDTDVIGKGYENMPLFLRHGFTALNYEQAMNALWDKEVLGKFPEMRTPYENIKEYVGSTLGINKAIFQHLIARRLYHVVDNRFQQFVNMGMDKNTAARRAVKLVNDTSFMLNPDIWGKEGKYFTTLLFTRNLTVGFIRQVTGMMHPVAQVFGIKHKNSPGALTNSLFHGEVSQADMDFLAKYYAQHLAKVVFAGVLINGLIQYGLSYLDDDKEDENGEQGGGFLATKRFMWNNEPGKKFSVRLPWKDHTNRRMYVDFQLLREARHLGDLFFDDLEDVPNNMIRWGKNRLNTMLRVFAEVLLNVDYSGRAIIADKENLPIDLQLELYSDYFKQQFSPLGFGMRREEKSYTGNKKLDTALTAIEIFGASKRYGTALGEGETVAEKQKLQKVKAVFTYRQEKQRRDVRWLTNSELEEIIGPYYSAQSYKNELKRRMAPYYMDWKRNKKALLDYFNAEKEE